MEEITLQALLEAGCHFGHKAERWHPKAADFIYTKKDGIHIIDLAKTKAGLTAAADFVRELASQGRQVLFVGTKRQARGVVGQEAAAVATPFLVERWIGGFLTNWDQIKKNIDKINRLAAEQVNGSWKKFPKHEQVKLARYLGRLEIFYSGVLELKELPAALYIVDIKKENAAVREAQRMGIPIVALVDTNADPSAVNYVIPANDDAVGSIELITKVIAGAVHEGKKLAAETAKMEESRDKETKPALELKSKKKRSRPKKKSFDSAQD